MACRTGLACGLTLTRAGASRNANHSAVISDTIEALDAWWPPTFTPERFTRTRLAWWTMLVASHSTRDWTRASVWRSTSVSTAMDGGYSPKQWPHQRLGHRRGLRPALLRVAQPLARGERSVLSRLCYAACGGSTCTCTC